ncbi:fused response regulator/phosphatase [Gracilinema caldarium]|uniref:fused response regulator/phosphatase n=1 Tax=Gracilinema caldarium TaxID=215591 RepID=UPI0026F070E2|nr:fused response regulator/phosphatase [Gracilinema caldarium]
MNSTYAVLIVDDSTTNRSYLHYILDEEGYEVWEAPSGEACLERVRQKQPRIILLDVVMTGIDGFETLKRLKADPQLAWVPVIMLTSTDDQASKIKAFELGAVDYIVKSANPAEIKARIRVHIRLSLANQELLQSKIESMGQIQAAQRALLLQPSDLPEARFSVFYQSFHEAGGDFYEVEQLAEDIFIYIIIDVAGHDVKTSYITPAVKVLIKQYSNPTYTMEEAFGYMGDILSQTVCQDTYLTAAALKINRRSLKATYLTAGHPPILYIPSQGTVQLLQTKNPPVAMMEGLQYHTETIDISSGDRFVLCTDGLLEMQDSVSGKTKAWVDSVKDLAAAGAELKTEPLGSFPQRLVQHFAELGCSNDDIAVLVTEV